jgi:hypothetical protein
MLNDGRFPLLSTNTIACTNWRPSIWAASRRTPELSVRAPAATPKAAAAQSSRRFRYRQLDRGILISSPVCRPLVAPSLSRCTSVHLSTSPASFFGSQTAACLVQTQARYQLLQPGVLIPQLLHFLCFPDLHAPVLPYSARLCGTPSRGPNCNIEEPARRTYQTISHPLFLLTPYLSWNLWALVITVVLLILT